ncbi:MAG: TlyA family RNA methyltransferase [Filifactor alocis]|nr:TlyA family RNA methyltransferase [Filifactor alocis]
MKQRIDVLLVEKDFYPTRERAKKNIMAGRVLVNEQIVDKPGTFDLSLESKVCMDIGSSTGGFTDCMLRNGARRVYCVDVGYGQLDWSLRTDERVIVKERTNIRKLGVEELEDNPDFFSIDVSFISLKLVLPKLRELGRSGFSAVALIKPQFEVGREDVGKNGVVRDPEKHKKAIAMCLAYLKENNLRLRGLTWSPIKGPKGNIEYLMYVEDSVEEDVKVSIDEVVDLSHRNTDIHEG